MKDQDQHHSVQETHDQRKEQKQEKRPSIQTHGLRLPAQQWARLLRQGDGMLELPAPLLEQLAKAVGNSSLAGLLRRGGGEDPALCAPDTLEREGPEPEVNHIRTAPPARFPFTVWTERNGPWPRPAKPGRIRDRG